MCLSSYDKFVLIITQLTFSNKSDHIIFALILPDLIWQPKLCNFSYCFHSDFQSCKQGHKMAMDGNKIV